MDFISIILAIWNSNYRLYWILIFYIYDLKCHIIYAVSFIYRIWFLIAFPNYLFKASFFFPRTMDLCTVTVNNHLLLFFNWFPHCPWVWSIILISAFIGNYLPSLHIVSIYHQGDPLPHIILNLVGGNVEKMFSMLCRLCCEVGTFRCQRRRLGPMSGRQPGGGGGSGKKQGSRPEL